MPGVYSALQMGQNIRFYFAFAALLLEKFDERRHRQPKSFNKLFNAVLRRAAVKIQVGFNDGIAVAVNICAAEAVRPVPFIDFRNRRLRLEARVKLHVAFFVKERDWMIVERKFICIFFERRVFES